MSKLWPNQLPGNKKIKIKSKQNYCSTFCGANHLPCLVSIAFLLFDKNSIHSTTNRVFWLIDNILSLALGLNKDNIWKVYYKYCLYLSIRRIGGTNTEHQSTEAKVIFIKQCLKLILHFYIQLVSTSKSFLFIY